MDKSRDTVLDVITIGRSSIDLYGQQIGTRLEDVASFAKSVGGCPSNIAIGAARMGLKSAVITRVGNEQMGRFIIEQMQREGVSTKGIVVDKERLTALAILGVENDEDFPLLFYRQNCADMALCEDDIDEAFIASSAAILVSGTHFSTSNTEAAQKKAIRLAKQYGRKVIFDIDYRPNLWGLAGIADGDQRYIASERVTNCLKTVLPDCDLIIGTEEEVMIASGEQNLLAALHAIRSLSNATIVLKRGPIGCIVYDGAIPDDLEKGIVGKGFPIEVYNVLGAGDSFMSGFLCGWLKGEDLFTCATWANACGAFAVSRLLCSPEIPTFEEMQYFLTHGSHKKALRHDEMLSHLHWVTTRSHDFPRIMAFAIDHRSQLEDVADRVGAPYEKIADFKRLAVRAAAHVAKGRAGYGMLLDERYGHKAMFDAAKAKIDWIGRPVEYPGSRPLQFEYSQDIGSQLVEWPTHHCIKALCFYHPDDPVELKNLQIAKLRTLYEAARKIGRELMVEIIAGKNGSLKEDTIACVLEELYVVGIKPDWWKLEPQANKTSWKKISDVIVKNDAYCRGVVLLGLAESEENLVHVFNAVADIPLVRGFAVGRTLFMAAAEKWLAGKIDDETAITDMATRFEKLTGAWLAAR